MDGLLPKAIAEMKSRFAYISKAGPLPTNPDVYILCDELINRFTDLSTFIYEKADMDNSLDTRQFNDLLLDMTVSTHMLEVPTSKDRLFYPYPTDHLESFLCPTTMPVCFQILPYLLSVYYFNAPHNRTIDLNGNRTTDSDEMLFDPHYGSTVKSPLPTNYHRTVDTFCNYFSAENQISKYLVQTEIQQMLKSCTYEALVRHLHHVKLSKINYGKVRQAYIYSLCVLACSRSPELSAKIDYLASAQLYQKHTLAFETTCYEHAKRTLKEFFSWGYVLAYYGDERELNTPDYLLNTGLSLTDIDINVPHTDSELAKVVPIIFCHMLHPKFYFPFRTPYLLNRSQNSRKPFYNKDV